MRLGVGQLRIPRGPMAKTFCTKPPSQARPPRPRGLLWNRDNGQPALPAACLPGAVPGGAGRRRFPSSSLQSTARGYDDYGPHHADG